MNAKNRIPVNIPPNAKHVPELDEEDDLTGTVQLDEATLARLTKQRAEQDKKTGDKPPGKRAS